VRARGDAGWYAVRKWLRRHRLVAAFAVALMTVTAAFTIKLYAMYTRAVQAEAAASRKYLMDRATAGMLIGTSASKLQNVAGVDAVRGTLADLAYEQLQDFARWSEDDFTLRAEQAQAEHMLGDVAFGRGEYAAALQHRQASLRYYQALAAELPDDPERQSDLSIALVLVGDVHGAYGDADRQLEYYLAAFQIDQQLVQRFPSVPEHRSHHARLCYSYERLGGLAMSGNDLDIAYEFLTLRRELAERLATAFPDNLEDQRNLYHALRMLAMHAVAVGDADARERLDTQAAPLIERIVAAEPNNLTYRFLAIEHGCGLAQRATSEKAAWKYFQRAMSDARDLLRIDPGSPMAFGYVSAVYSTRGAWLSDHGRFLAAARQMRKAIAAYEPLYRKNPDLPDRALRVLDNLAVLRYTRLGAGWHGSSGWIVRRTAELVDRWEHDPLASETITDRLISALTDERCPGLFDPARALAIAQTVLDRADRPTARDLAAVARCLDQLGEWEAAASAAEAALALAGPAECTKVDQWTADLERYRRSAAGG